MRTGYIAAKELGVGVRHVGAISTTDDAYRSSSGGWLRGVLEAKHRSPARGS